MVEIVKLLLEQVFSLGVKKSLFSILIGLLVMFYVISMEIITSLILSILLAVITYITCVLILSFVDGVFISYKYSLEKKRAAKEEDVKRIISFLQSLSPIEENRLEQFMKNNNRPEACFSGYRVVAMGKSIPEEFFEIVDLPQEVKESINGTDKVISTKKGKKLKPKFYKMFSQIWPIWERIKLEQAFYS